MKRLSFGESDQVEFKKCCGGKVAQLPSDLWQTICAFSNTRGGTTYLGIDDNGYNMNLPAEDLDKLQKDLSSLMNSAFSYKPKVDIVAKDGYLMVTVSELEFYNKPIYHKKTGVKQIWIRQGSTNVRANDEEMRSLFAGATGGGENQPIYGDSLKFVDKRKLDEYILHTGLKTIGIQSTATKLSKVKAKKGSELTIFGLVAFGKDDAIDENLSNIHIDFKIFPGTSKVSPSNLEKIYTKRREFHGDLKTQFAEAFKYISSKLPTESYLDIESGLRKERYILPEDALREALSNAIAHRDYLMQSSCVNIDLYTDRIELTNPGESLVAIEDLERVSSKARNPNIMEYLKVYKITDKTARGIPIIVQAARNRGLLKPSFNNISGSFRTTLYFSAPHTDEDEIWAENIASSFGLKDTQKNALVFIKNNSSISNKQYCKINHMQRINDDRRARRELNDMVEKGLITAKGFGRGTRYELLDDTINIVA